MPFLGRGYDDDDDDDSEVVLAVSPLRLGKFHGGRICAGVAANAVDFA